MNVTVYTRPACQQCRATFRKLESLNVPHTAVDVSENTEALTYIKSLGYLQAPVIVLGDGSHWSGYRPELLNQLEAK